jgi:HemX protein
MKVIAVVDFCDTATVPMPQDKIYVFLATLSCACGFFSAAAAWRRGVPLTGWRSVGFLGAAWLFLSVFLKMRGQEIHQCPLTNVPELLIFISWGLLGLYCTIGSSYRWSLLGLFTAPMVLSLLCVALVRPDPRPERIVEHEFWNELHKALSVLSYGAFALACVAGVMFVIQEKKIKQRNVMSIFHQLPPLINLHKAMVRLLALGLVVLSGGMASAYLMPDKKVAHALLPVWGVWAAYAGILLFSRLRGGSARKEAWAAIIAFVFALVTLMFLGH